MLRSGQPDKEWKIAAHRPGAPWQATSDLMEVEVAVEAEGAAMPVPYD